MQETFDLVYNLLKWISEITGFTYREVNVIIYFILIPSLFFFLISRILRKKYPILVFLVFVSITIIAIPDFEQFSNRLFNGAVGFLNWFNRFGLNYTNASVVICVVLPIVVVCFLAYWYLKTKPNNKVS